MESVGLLWIVFVGIQASSLIGGLSPVNGTDSTSDTALYLEADQFLTNYGYYPSSELLSAQVPNPSPIKHPDTERTKALKLFQKFYNLPQSGKLDKETSQLMQSPRCGNPDITSNQNTKGTPADLGVEKPENEDQISKDNKNQYGNGFGVIVDIERRSLDKSRKKRAKPMTGRRRRGKLVRWGYKNDVIGWSITRPSKQKHLQPVDVQRKIVQKALSTWEPILPFKFVENKIYRSGYYMEIKFHSFAKSSWTDKLHGGKAWRKNKIRRPKHGPKRKGSHAHTMVSTEKEMLRQRDIHFNEDKNWSNHEELLSVLLHEIGHALGLGHSFDETSVMYPYNRDVTELSVSDIEAIESVYEPKDGRLRRVLCDTKIRNVDTIFEVIKTPNSAWSYLFIVISGNKLEVMTPKSGAVMTFKRYDQFFLEAPSKYDLVFSDIFNNRVFFIAGKTVHEYWMTENYVQFPRKTYTHDFPETPKFALAMLHLRRHRYEIFLYGETLQWYFEFRDRTIQNSSSIKPMDEATKQLISASKFALQMSDHFTYYVMHNGSYRILYWRIHEEPILTRVKTDIPHWMEAMMCPGQAVSIRMSKPSLVLVIMLSLIKLS